MIPQCKTWIVRINGKPNEKFEIWAPNKILAKLNFQHEYGWVMAACIKSISVKR